MPSSIYQFDTLDTLVDDIHVLFDQWETNGRFDKKITATAVHRLKLAVHEWAANLIQHAEFEDRAPRIELCIWREEEKLYCTVEDNSNGFELEERISEDNLNELARTMPERGMGLLMMQESAEEVEYCHLENGRHQIQLSVRIDDSTCETASSVSPSRWRMVLRMSGGGFSDEK